LEQQIGGVERQELVDIARKEDHTPAAAIAIGGSGRQHECRGSARELLWPDTAEGGGRCRVICRGSVAAASPVSFSPGAILGLTYVSAAGAAQFTGATSARGGRGAELQSKGKHGGN